MSRQGGCAEVWPRTLASLAGLPQEDRGTVRGRGAQKEQPSSGALDGGCPPLPCLHAAATRHGLMSARGAGYQGPRGNGCCRVTRRLLPLEETHPVFHPSTGNSVHLLRARHGPTYRQYTGSKQSGLAPALRRRHVKGNDGRPPKQRKSSGNQSFQRLLTAGAGGSEGGAARSDKQSSWNSTPN